MLGRDFLDHGQAMLCKPFSSAVRLAVIFEFEEPKFGAGFQKIVERLNERGGLALRGYRYNADAGSPT